jgi:hypothetical protein
MTRFQHLMLDIQPPFGAFPGSTKKPDQLASTGHS